MAISAALLGAVPLLSQSNLVPLAGAPIGLSALPAVASTPPPSVAAGVFPLAQVHRGLHGVAYTVFEGTQPEPMDLEILGVLRNFRGPGQDMILARLAGAKPEYTGVVAGMSGSPVYIDGKLVGALAYRIGQFSKEPIAGITPIADMLEVRDQSPPKTSDTPNRQVANGQTASLHGGEETTGLQPIETPLVFNGYSDEAIKLWRTHSLPGGTVENGTATDGQRAGTLTAGEQTGALEAVSGVGGSSSSQLQPEPIVPGSAVSAILVRGDMDISATCTVTYVDPTQLLACGHPITQFGAISMPMTKAEVVATLASPLNAFKIVNTTETVGSFDQDRESAIRGHFGVAARMLPVSVHIHGVAAPYTVHFEVVDQPDVTPDAIMVSIYQSLLSSNSYAAETTYRIHGTLDVEGLPSVRFDSILAPSDQVAASLGAALMIGDRFGRLYDDASRRTNFDSLTLDFEAIPGRRSLDIESASAGLTDVRAGQTIHLEVTLRPYRGEPSKLNIPVTLPANLPQGPVRLLISDGGTIDRVSLSGRSASKPLDLRETILQLNSLHANDRLYVTLLDPSAQASLEGRTLQALPISMANILEPLRNNQEMTLNGESALPVTSVAVDAMLSGQQVISLNVE